MKVIRELKPEKDDSVLKKQKDDGFIDADLEAKLRDLGVRDLIFMGIGTNISVEATIRHVFSRGCEESGVAEEECPPDLSGAFCLRDEEVREIAKLGILLEQHFGVPQDVEWAIDRDVELPKSIGYRLEKGNVVLSPLRKRFNLSQREL